MEELVNAAEHLQQLQEQLEAKEAQADKLIASSKVTQSKLTNLEFLPIA